MACISQTLNGLAQDCAPNIGGIRRVWLIPFDYVASVSEADGKVDFEFASGHTIADAKLYEFRRGTSSLTSTYTVDDANGVKFVTTDLLMQFNRMETTKRVEIAALALSELRAWVEDNNGVVHFLGKDEPLRISAGDGQTGTALTDANRYQITLQDISKEMPFEAKTAPSA